MDHGTCPTLGELGQFLEEQLEAPRQAEIGTHVDMCLPCQTVLEWLTGCHPSDFIGLSAAALRASPGSSARDQIPADKPAGIENGTNRLPRYDTGPCPGSQLEGHTSLDPYSTRSGVLQGETSADQGSRGPDKPADPRAVTERTERDRRSGLPRIASYELLGVLGQGGMGVVYKARQRGLNRLVAVKMIRGDRPGRTNELARFRIEAEAVARLRHPNIVQIFEIGETSGAPYVSLELLEGGSLAYRLAGTPQPGRAAAELVITLARAVHFAHDAGIIHRDLKPSNILFTEDGIPKIADFGLAKRLESDSRQTETGQILGSPSYMAPEQARGHTRDVGPTADVYALGAILYEMLTGRPPFKGETPIETVRQVTDIDVVPPSRLVPRVARDLETICLHCLKKEQSRRYRSALALAEDLESFLGDRPIKARRTPFWERGGKLARRHPIAAASFAFGLGATLVLTAVWLEYSSRETQRQAKLRSEIIAALFEAQYLVAKNRWGDAEPALTAIQTEIRRERSLADFASQTAALLASAQNGRDADETRRHDQERLRTFRVRHRDALFHETHFTGLALPYAPETVTSSARAVLAVFAAPGTGKVPEFGPLPASLTPREHDEVREGCFEAILILADAEQSADRGLELLDQAGRLGPPTRAYHLRRAACLDRRGDARRAQSEREQAKAVVVDSALDQYLLGKDLYKRGEWSAALSHLDAALLSQAGNFWAHCLSAVCSTQLGRAIQAKTELTACLQIEPDLPWLHALRGFASYQFATLARAAAAASMQAQGKTLHTEFELQLQAAEADYASALKLLNSAPNKDLKYILLVNRGLLWLERREWKKAVADLEEAIHLDATRWQAFETLAQVYERQNNPDQAIDQFTRAIRLRPDWAPLYRARAAVNLARKDQGPSHRDQALADLEQAIRLESPGSSVVALDQARRARLLLQEARHEEALAACDAALRIDRDHLEAHLVRIEVLRKLNRYAEAIGSCDALLTRGKPSAELHELRGLAREKINDYQGAIVDYTLAIGLQPEKAEMLGTQQKQQKSAGLWARRGVLYLVTDAPRSALRDFQEAVRLDSRSADAYVGRGLALAALGQHREAVAAAAKALGLGEPTTIRLYSAARIYAQAAYAAGAEARKEGQEAVSLFTRYQDQAIGLLREWLKRLPAAERASSLRDLQQDPAMAILRRRLRPLNTAGTSYKELPR